jgi:hypothetical protein
MERMRKRIGRSQHSYRSEADEGWLDLEQIATIEVTSEAADYPIESALRLQDGRGWRASESGEQQIRIIFDEPVALHRMQLRFHEADRERTQEFTLRWSGAASAAAAEIARQQWNFSPGGSTTETEEYAVDLNGVSVLELTIRPDLGRGEAAATLASWRMR